MKIFVPIVAATLLASGSTAFAGSPFYVGQPYAGTGPIDPDASGEPNVPNLQGCVKWCQRDLNPCDPPNFKRADGRCGPFD